MLFTRKLITKFIPDFKTINDIVFNNAVNALGMEIESIYHFPKIDNVVVGQLLEANKVEGTHLSLCKVKIGNEKINQIVCGASNLQVGKKVIVALEGAKLPNGVIISKRQIHGMESNGMMCAYFELSNNKSVVSDKELDEIIMLDEGEIGSQDWISLIGFDDTIYDITVPANRNDENAYLVFCYEIAHKLNLLFNFNFADMVRDADKTESNLIIDNKLCSSLCFLNYSIDSKMVSRSDWKTKSLLMNHGIKPFNYLLDKLSLITILTNCPTNVYDDEKLVGQLRCKSGHDGLKFIALNGKTYDLNKNDIVIYDQNQPVSLACLIGSEYTKFTDKTKKIRIEVGNFDYAHIRNSAIRLNIDTDASKRAARPLSNYLNLLTIELIKKEFGLPTSFISYIRPNWVTKWIKLSYRTLDWFINEEITKEFATSALRNLGYKFDWLLKTKFKAPLWRLDVNNQEDMFEDILKIIDLNKLKPISVEDKLLPIENNKLYGLKQELKNILMNNYFNEVKTYNLTRKDNLNKFNMFQVNDPIKIQSNNLNREYFRTSLVDNMLKVYKYNSARKLSLIPIFEIQNLFSNSKKITNLTCLCLDKYQIDSITKSLIFTNANYLKSLVNEISKAFNNKLTFKVADNDNFYSNESIQIISNNNVIGYIGKIRKSLLKPYDLSNENIYLLTMNIESLFNNFKDPIFKVKEFGVFQRISKDINITLPKDTSYQITEKINQIKKITDIIDARIIDTFEKDGQIVYTIRYYLVDTKQFKTNDIDLISQQIESIK